MRRWRNLPFRRGSFWNLPRPPAAATTPPAWVAPLLRQSRRIVPLRRRVQPPAIPAPAATPVPQQGHDALRLLKPPRGRFLAPPPIPAAAAAPPSWVPPHLRQRRAQPLRVPRGHRADPPWLGSAAAPVLPAVPQFPRQSAARARLPRRGCLFGVPSAPAGNTSPGPLAVPLLRPASSRPRWPARPRRGCFYYLTPVVGPPPPFTVGTLTASGVPAAVLTAAGAASALTAATVAQGTLTAGTQRTGGPS